MAQRNPTSHPARRPRYSTRRAHPEKKERRLPGWIRWGALVLLVLVATGVLIYFNNPKIIHFGPTPTPQALPYIVSVNKAYVMYTEGNALLLDVRTTQEFGIYRIPDINNNRVLNIPLDELKSRLDEIPRDRDIVVLCATGRRSETGREILQEADFSRVTSMSGGIEAWRDNGLPLEGTYSY